LESSPPVEILLTAAVSPSESREKVMQAAKNILGGCLYETEEAGETIILTSRDPTCLKTVHDQLRDRHVRDAARRLLLRNREQETTSLILNRQAAYVGIVALCGAAAESPLGPLVLEMRSSRVEELIDWLTAH
jgi:uncharacterized protein